MKQLFEGVRVLPVVTLDDPRRGVEVARALLRGGLGVVEITMRTPAALECVERVRAELPELVVGVGTVTTPSDLEAANRVNAAFAVSPGCTPELLAAARDSQCPFLPGVSTASEALVAREAGFDVQKLFPAEAVGGPRLLRSIAGPLPDLSFCPTGGIGPHNLADYLELPNVLCAGGGWLTPPNLIEAERFSEITDRALEVSQP